MLFRAILEDDSDGIYQGYKVFSSTDTDPMLPYACVIQAALLPIARDNAVLPTEAHSRNYRQNLAAVSLCKKYNWTPFFGNNGDTYIVAEGETKAALIANLHEFQSDFSASFRFAQDANLFAGRIVDDSMDLSYSLASIAGLRSLPLFTSNELHSYALLSEYQQQIIEFEKANKKGAFWFCCFPRNNFAYRYWPVVQSGSAQEFRSTLGNGLLYDSEHYWLFSYWGCTFDIRLERTDGFLYFLCWWRFWCQLLSRCISVCFLPFGKRADNYAGYDARHKNGKEYINQHFCESISLSEVADYCNVNSSYLSNLFHKQLGISYSKYLMQIRMERAAAYLKDSPETKIYEIGEKLGFVSTKHFIPFSKKYYGVSPTTYQKEQRES